MARGADLLPLVYAELRRLAHARMAKVPPGNTLQPTDLVHEAYVRLAKDRSRWDGRGHFFVAAAEAMRRILVEQARRKATRKHGGDLRRVDADEIDIPFAQPVEDVLALHEAIDRLQEEDPRKAQVVVLRCFAGLSREEIAAALGVSVPTVDRDWRYITARLHQELTGHDT
jgi:RNA polymerase sigma factor (TIGR02999 family)